MILYYQFLISIAFLYYCFTKWKTWFQLKDVCFREHNMVFAVLHPWCFSPFDTICPILKTWKGPIGSFSTLLHECFSRFLNYTNDTKSRKVSHFLMFLRQFPFFQTLLLFVFIFRHRLTISTTPIEYYKCICIWIWIC